VRGTRCSRVPTSSLIARDRKGAAPFDYSGVKQHRVGVKSPAGGGHRRCDEDQLLRPTRLQPPVGACVPPLTGRVPASASVLDVGPDGPAVAVLRAKPLRTWSSEEE